MAVISFIACNTDSNNSTYTPPTQEEAKAMFANVGNTRVGGLIYLNPNPLNVSDKQDTIPNITCTINQTDSTASFMFPVRILSKFVSEENLGETIAKQADKKITFSIIPWMYNNCTFVANPWNLELGDLTGTDGKIYKNVTFTFWQNSYLAGIATSNNQSIFYISMYARAIYINGNQTTLLANQDATSKMWTATNQVPFLFTTSK